MNVAAHCEAHDSSHITLSLQIMLFGYFVSMALLAEGCAGPDASALPVAQHCAYIKNTHMPEICVATASLVCLERVAPMEEEILVQVRASGPGICLLGWTRVFCSICYFLDRSALPCRRMCWPVPGVGGLLSGFGFRD